MTLGFDTWIVASFWGKSVQQSLCEGKENCAVLNHDALKLQVYKYNLQSAASYIRVLFYAGKCFPQSRHANWRVLSAGWLWLSFLLLLFSCIFVALTFAPLWLEGTKFPMLRWKWSHRRYYIQSTLYVHSLVLSGPFTIFCVIWCAFDISIYMYITTDCSCWQWWWG